MNLVIFHIGKDNRYIQRATLDGKPYTKNYLSHEDILRGGVLAFVMSDEPNPSWGSAPADCPPSLVNETPGVTVWELGRRDGSAGEPPRLRNAALSDARGSGKNGEEKTK